MRTTRHFSILSGCLFLLCYCLSASASSVVLVTFSFTNSAGTTNGQSLTVNGDTRTFTNSVVVPSAQIFTNSTPGGSASNTWNQLNAFPFSGFRLSSPFPISGVTNVTISSVLQSDPPTSPTVSISGNWGTFVIFTNSYVDMTVVRIPIGAEPSAAVRTNVESALVPAIMDSGDTNLNLLIAPKAISAVNSTNFFGTLSPTNFDFGPRIVPDSQGTNWIPNFKSWHLYSTILLTNDMNLQYVTNGPGVMTLRLLPNGADRILSVNTNWRPMFTNAWTLSTAVNPGAWWTVITNAEDGNGPREFDLSLTAFDPASASQTNVQQSGVLVP